MDFTPIRKFSETLDLFPILKDLNNNEEAIKWAWLNAFSKVLQREGIHTKIPIYKFGRCTEDGTIKIYITSDACFQMNLLPQDSMLGASINIGVEAKKLATAQTSKEAAFAQRVWYDSKIYRNSFNTTIDVVCVCTEKYIALAYKHKNKEIYYRLLDFYDNHSITRACDIYKDFPEIREITKGIIWEPLIVVDVNLCVEDVISKIFTDLLNGSNIATVANG